MFQPNAKTKLFVLLGNPVGHSLSPAIHNAAFEDLGLHNVYLACPVEDAFLGAAVKGIKALSIAGANVTSPHKEAVIPFLDQVSREAELVQSVNTIVNREGHLQGTTTDGEGLHHSLKQADPNYKAGQNILVLGAGGAARAASYTLANKGAQEILIANRSQEKSDNLRAILLSNTAVRESKSLPLQKEAFLEALMHCRLIIYSLPHDEQIFLEALSEINSFNQDKFLLDLRYSPARSPVMEAFEKCGGRTVNGLAMLTHQAALSFELFTGVKAPLEVMQKKAGILPG
ncbi:MAG: shikimate dehydrogenase [Bacillota bacterium]